MSEFFIADFDGLNVLPAGTLTTRYPWSQLNTTAAGSIVAAGGAFGGNCLTMNAGTNLVQALTFAFPNFGTFQRNNTTNTGKGLYGFGAWIRIDATAATLATSTLIGFSSLLTSGIIPLVTVSNSNALGVELNFPTNLTTPATNPLKVNLQIGTYYWFYAKFAITPNANIRASYYLNNLPIAEDLQITMTNDPISTSPMDRVVFMGGNNQCRYSVDDIVVQAIHGGDSKWPSGFTNTTANDPVVGDLPVITSRRIRDLPLIANGSVNEFTPTDSSMENWQAASSTTEKVQATERDLTDLYKVEANEQMVDVIAVKFQIATDTYFSLTSATKDSEESPVADQVGIINRGGSSMSYVLEKASDGTDWDNTKIQQAEFGLKTL